MEVAQQQNAAKGLAVANAGTAHLQHRPQLHHPFTALPWPLVAHQPQLHSSSCSAVPLSGPRLASTSISGGRRRGRPADTMASLPADASGDGGGSGSAGMVSTLAALRATVIQRVDQYDKDR